jgi:hypothetical protein
MRESSLRLIKQSAEFQPKEAIALVPTNRRGLYVLYNLRRVAGKEHYDVVYVGIGTRGMKRRLKAHAKSKRKSGLWTHFSAFEVWQNIRDEEIVELEGLFRHIFRRDSKANALAIQKTFKKAERIREDDLKSWR